MNLLIYEFPHPRFSWTTCAASSSRHVGGSVLRRNSLRQKLLVDMVRSKPAFLDPAVKSIEEVGDCSRSRDDLSSVAGNVKIVDADETLDGQSVGESAIRFPLWIAMPFGVEKLILCGILVLWGAKMILSPGEDRRRSELEKEMMRRKMKSRAKRGTMLDGGIEIHREQSELPVANCEKPEMNKEELMKRIHGASTLISETMEAEDRRSPEIVHIEDSSDAEGFGPSQEDEALQSSCVREDATEEKDSPELSGRKKRIILSVKEARELIARKSGEEVRAVGTNSASHTDGDDGEDFEATEKPCVSTENWLERNIHRAEPIIKKISDGFRRNYSLAREASKELDAVGFVEPESDSEWMEDEALREIVFQVRENELAGRHPFDAMDEEDKKKFFLGLEKMAERQNEKLYHLHEYLHSNIENLDYGADGISIYDPPEKIIPRWKNPPCERDPEFLKTFIQQRRSSSSSKKNEPVIEGSDGSARKGKRSGKEYWEHTKKWTREFLESYNAETDPEVKETMRSMGKDLARWATEEEMKQAAETMSSVREMTKQFVDMRISKLRRELEMFGPQAVVSKYREYCDEEEEEDTLWWLDLPHVMCIETYPEENEEQEMGMYCLEMAPDLELEPKPCHVIAFEDAADCKNFRYILQAEMETHGKGQALVIPWLPKDVFREAKANGVGVTVIKRGELKLSIDKTLEEVEEEMVEIGSKTYHDKIINENSVDTESLVKGYFGATTKMNMNKRYARGRLCRKEGKRELKN